MSTVNVDEVNKLIYRKDYASLQQLVAEGVDVNLAGRDGRTPLMHAVLAADAETKMIKFLVNAGANPRTFDKQRWTALHFAARDQKMAIVSALLECELDVNAEDSFGNTPLWRCVIDPRAREDVVRLLLGKGADPVRKNHSGVSPRDIAEKTGNTKLIAMLCSEGNS